MTLLETILCKCIKSYFWFEIIIIIIIQRSDWLNISLLHNCLNLSDLASVTP